MSTETIDLVDRIAHLHPCDEALQWLGTLPANTTPLRAWRLCPRGDWMLWLIVRTIAGPPWSDSRKPVLACCLDCAETVKHLLPAAHKDKIAAAINILRAWIAGEATVEQAQTARNELAVAADAATYAAAAATYAADAAAAARTNDAAARTKNRADTAEIARRHYPKPPKISA